MAATYDKEWPVGENWVQNAGERKILLELDEYEFVNLRWMLEMVMKDKRHPNYHTGDWTGQILYAMQPVAADLEPNGFSGRYDTTQFE